MSSKEILLADAGLSVLAEAASANDDPHNSGWGGQSSQLEEILVSSDPFGRSGNDVLSNVAPMHSVLGLRICF